MIETARDLTGPRIKQLSFFVQSRVGTLLRVVRKLEDRNIRICAISILDSADYAVIRLVTDRPAEALDALHDDGHAAFETELLGVELPREGQVGIRKILSALLLAEVNVHYVYSLIVQSHHRPVLALHVDDIPTSIQVFKRHGLNLIGQDEISWDEDGE